MFKLGVIGGGVMAEAIISRLISANIYQPTEIIISDPQLERRNYLAKHYGVRSQIIINKQPRQRQPFY